jgi:DNA-binding transcriptional MerR regulator
MRNISPHLIMASQLQSTTAEPTAVIPDRLYFKIGDVARICALEPYVLRFWESQFPQLKVNKSGTGQRLYRRRDVELVLEIKRLVHGQGFTLAGARHALEQANQRPNAQKTLPLTRSTAKRSDGAAAALERVRAELREIAGMLAVPATRPPRRRTRFATVASGELFSS